MVRYDLENGDSYIGEVVLATSGRVVLRNYSAWYEGSSEPFSPHPEDEVSFSVTSKTRVEQF
jgi:hypothetical protein